MNIKQFSEFETKSNKLKNNIANIYEKILINKNKNSKKIFVIGNYCSGTRWLNYLIIKNTPINHIYSLRNQHNYLDDNNNIKKNFKHGTLTEEILIKKNIIIYIIRDFNTFLKSFLNNNYDNIKNKIILNKKFTIYEWYCKLIEINVKLLRKFASNYIIVNMKQIQKDKGGNLLNILNNNGFNFIKPYKYINKHTKTKKDIINRTYSNLLNKNFNFEKNNKIIENIIQIYQKPEIKIYF